MLKRPKTENVLSTWPYAIHAAMIKLQLQTEALTQSASAASRKMVCGSLLHLEALLEGCNLGSNFANLCD